MTDADSPDDLLKAGLEGDQAASDTSGTVVFNKTVSLREGF